MSRIRAETDPSVRRGLVYGLGDALRSGRLAVSTAAEARDLATLLADLLDRDSEKVTRWRAATLLVKYPHPAVSDALLRAVARGEELERNAALVALVALHDRRVLPLLLQDLERPGGFGHEATIHLLGDLGDRGALPALDAMVRAADRAERAVAASEESLPPGRMSGRGSGEDVGGRSREVLSADRRAARQAARRIRLATEAGILCPFDLDHATHELLRRNGFAIVPETANDMYELIEGEYPFVTSDIAFHSFMILVREALHELERLVLAPRLGAFARDAARACVRQAAALGDSTRAALARRNAAFLATGAVLLGTMPADSTGLPAPLAAAVAAEVRNVLEHGAPAPSALFDRREDWTRYLPRGRHGSDPALHGFFQAMLLFGRMGFRLDSESETEQALLLADAVAREPRLGAEWRSIDRLLGQFFGPHDDLTFTDYEVAAGRVLERAGRGTPAGFVAVAREPALVADLVAELRQRPAPRIHSEYQDRPTPADWPERSAGLRLFGQRCTRPEVLFQWFLDAGRWPASGLHVATMLLGSDRAAAIMREEDSEGPRRARRAPIPTRAEGDSSLTEGFLHCARALFEPEPGMPAFMRRAAWGEKQINAALSAWAEVANTSLLYTKDAAVYLCESGALERFHGWVEPVPRFYERLDGLVLRMLALLDAQDLFARIEADRQDGGARRGADSTESASGAGLQVRLLPGDPQNQAAVRLERRSFEDLDAILRRLARIARSELRGEPQSIDDGVFLKSLHPRFKDLALNRSNSARARESMALVADVATEYLAQECLEIGVGRPCAMYVAVPDGDRTFVCRGAVYTYYEFVQPISERLDDAKWKRLAASPLEGPYRPWIARRPLLGWSRD